VHEQVHRTEDALRMIDKAHQLAEIRSAAQVDDALERRVMVLGFADLHEQDPPSQLIDDRLIARLIPPFYRVVEFSARTDDPEWQIFPDDLLDCEIQDFSGSKDGYRL